MDWTGGSPTPFADRTSRVVPSSPEDDERVRRHGADGHPRPDVETEYRPDAREAGEFPVSLGEQLRDGDERTVVDDERELPFAFGEPVGLEIDYEGVGGKEPEIGTELPGRSDGTAPDVE